MSKNRRKNELPSQEKESFQCILNRSTSTSLLKHLRTWHHPGGSFLLPSVTCSPCLGTLHPPGLGSLALLCTSLPVKWISGIQKIWHLFFKSLCITGRIRKGENLLKNNPEGTFLVLAVTPSVALRKPSPVSLVSLPQLSRKGWAQKTSTAHPGLARPGKWPPWD